VNIQVKENVLAKNDQLSEEIKALFTSNGIFVLNLMGSPGSGKTSLLEHTLVALKSELRIAVIEGDLFTTKDAERIACYDIPVVQINTGGGCHLDANMIKGAMKKLDLPVLDLVVIENVGNLICPAEFNVGEDVKATVLSITEGEDKPLKYPLMFRQASIAIFNKIDLLPYTSFNMVTATADVLSIHPQIVLVRASCRTGEGLEDWYEWLRQQVKNKKQTLERGLNHV